MNNLARYRELRGLRQEDLAEMIGKATSTVNRAEKEHPSAKLETYKACAKALKITIAQIFADDRSDFEVAAVDVIRLIDPAHHQRTLDLLEMAKSLPASVDE